MSQFEPAVEKVLLLEGGLIDKKSDRNGITNFGISLRFLRGLNSQATADDIRELTQEKAIEIYHVFFWRPSGIEQINDQLLSDKLFDLAVDIGKRNAILLLQNALGMQEDNRDGNLGPITILAANEANPQILLKLLQLEAICYYYEIVQVQPSQRGFLKDWIGRCFT